MVLCFGYNIEAQQAESPKVGLVLSGGGAKGFAHIGTLKVIDSLGIKVDYISGTSMGAIIGSLYASGYSGKQLDSLFKSIDFDVLINDKFSRESQSLFERKNSEKYAFGLPFDNFKIKLPTGLSRGQNVYNMLYKLMLPVNEITDFKDLPIPFFCVATNVETGESVVLDKGNLALAVAASGAFPSLFQPVEINNNLYIDGGVTNNYPIEELKAKGVDIIIGVDVQDDLRDREALKSAPDILVQINNFRTIEAMKTKRQLTDIYIKPDITNFSVISFSEGKDIIKNGETATYKEINALVTLAKEQNAFHLRPKIKMPDSVHLNKIRLKGHKRYTRSYILGKLKLRGDEKVSFKTIEKGIDNLVATNNFEVFRYQLVKNEGNNTYDLVAEINESEEHTFLRLGAHYDDLYNSGALLNVTRKRTLFKNDIASFDVVLGDNFRYDFDYFIDKGFYISIGLKSRFNQFERRVDADLLLESDDPLILGGLNRVDVEYQDQTNQLYLQTLLAKAFALQLGVEHKRLKITSETLIGLEEDEDIIFENTDYLSVFGGLKIDTYDNRYFPKNGFFFDGDVHFYIAASNFNQGFDNYAIAKADIGYAFNINEKLAFNLQTSGGFRLGDQSTTSLNFTLGGYGNNFVNNISSFYGYDYLSLVGNSFVKANFNVDYELIKKHHIILSGNYANIEDNIFDTTEWFSEPDFSGYALGYSIETFLGPVEGKFTWSPETGDSFLYFNVGFWF